jgi:hypothetical protein
MDLNKCIHAYLDTPGYYTQDSLVVPSDLAAVFRDLRKRSEKAVREYGVNLYWRGEDGSRFSRRAKLHPTKKPYVGSASGTSVNLDSKKECQKATYIGDFHTHPYELKMGGGAAPGPSTGDLDGWFQEPPKSFDVSVHFVASSTTLYLLITRGGLPMRLDFSVAEPDTERLNTYAYTIPALAKALESSDNAVRKQAWAQHAPRAGQEFTEDNLAMNIAMANHHKYEFFYGVDSGSGPITVHLASRHVHGSKFQHFRDSVYFAYEEVRKRGPITIM